MGTVEIVLILFFGCIIGGILLLSFFKNKKIKNVASNTAAGNTKKKSDIRLMDSKLYISDIEDIQDGILISNGWTRFTTGITCRGTDFYNEGATDQLSIMQGYQQFLNLITEPITYSIYTKALDVDFAKTKYQNKIDETLELFDAAQKEESKAVSVGDKKSAELCHRNVIVLRQRLEHLTEQLEGLNFYSDIDVVQDEEQSYFFSWEYVADAGAPLSKVEILQKAKSELDALISQKCDALIASGVKAKKVTQSQMEEMCRRVSKPVTADQYKQRDVEASSFGEDIISSTSYNDFLGAITDNVEYNLGANIMDIIGEALSKPVWHSSTQQVNSITDESSMADKEVIAAASEEDTVSFDTMDNSSNNLDMTVKSSKPIATDKPTENKPLFQKKRSTEEEIYE